MQQTTPAEVYFNRRQFIRACVAFGLLAPEVLAGANKHITPQSKATRYNNYYEFSSNKELVHVIAQDFQTDNWQIKISGLVKKELVIDLADFKQLERVDRVYPLRCVEGWSFVAPWHGIMLKDLLALVEPTAEAKFVEFVGTFRPSEMINQRRDVLPWPYTEGLRLDEAMHPLTMLATGMYGDDLPKQNGAPVRLLVPWKYGFKSIKAISQINLVAHQPVTSWNQIAASEYGFYANVNPQVAHPRWSQRKEVRLGELKKVRTQMFNGFADQVSALYRNMDLTKDY
ncbi:protein-methionine-sulfoxide reductase catalytic subunit MsrP [Catenovulum sp. SX2]|uniref:protein-methionine-sulfoxide reductase catalytic subunit MsrP n=1 Tax=Catenovulum sp. SX2 TaxID=3398614 RepID=UPI003F83F961